VRKSFVYIAFGAVTLLGIALLTAFPAQPSKASQPGVQTAVGAPQIVCLSQDGSRGHMFLNTKATPGASNAYCGRTQTPHSLKRLTKLVRSRTTGFAFRATVRPEFYLSALHKRG